VARRFGQLGKNPGNAEDRTEKVVSNQKLIGTGDKALVSAIFWLARPWALRGWRHSSERSSPLPSVRKLLFLHIKLESHRRFSDAVRYFAEGRRQQATGKTHAVPDAWLPALLYRMTTSLGDYGGVASRGL
jgi:hypothetical protein